MTHSQSTHTPLLTIRFASTISNVPNKEPIYSVHLHSSAVGDASGEMIVPFGATTWRSVQFALEPNFDPQNPPKELYPHLEPLGDLTRLKPTIGDILGEALLASPDVRSLFDRTLALAVSNRQTLPVELRFGEGCDELAALPWELIRYDNRFLVGDTSIALSRYPEGLIPPTPVLADLPLRVLLVLSEPLDASPIFPARAKEELLHGLRSLDEDGAVIVDELKPPSFDTLVEAVRNGQYHMLIFYGHGGHGDGGGILLFEDEFGRGDQVPAAEVGATLRNTEVRLVLLGACKSATVNPLPSPPPGRFAKEKEQFGDSDGDGQIRQGTAAALVKAGVPLALGMQVSMRVDAAQAFLRQFALSLAAGKEITEAVADARLPILRRTYGESWFIPALYGRPKDGQRLFDASKPLPTENAELRATMKEARSQIEQLERTIGSVGVMGQGSEMVELRAARQRFADARFDLALNTDGGYHQVTSPLYGVPPQKLFVGRSDEMMEVGQALKQNNPVVIWGVGGLGKSALATEVVYRQSWRFPGGVLWLDCHNGPPFESLLERIAAFCGLADLNQTPPDEKEGVVRALLARLEDRCLLIWDNAEDVWTDGSTRRFIQSQLPANVQSMLTTRVDPDQTNWPTIEIRPLADPTMNDLFVALATAKGVKIGSQNDLDVIAPMLTWLEGHPLALELLIPLAHRRGLTRVWAELQKRPLKGIDAAFDISYQGLTSEQQRLFARLSVFMIAFEYTAAHALLSDSEDVDDNLDMLVQRALIHFDGSRYGYHALVRQFGYEKLFEQIDVVEAVHELAAKYLLEEANSRSRTPDEFLEEVDQWEKAKQWEIMGWRASTLVGSLDLFGYWAEIEERLRKAWIRIQDLEESQNLFATLSSARGSIATKQARWTDAIDSYKIAQKYLEQVEDVQGVAQCWGQLALLYQSMGEWGKALSLYEKALKYLKQAGTLHDLATTYNNMSESYRAKGDWKNAKELQEKSLETFEELGDNRGVSAALGTLGNLYLSIGDWENAISYQKQSLEIKEQLGDIHGIAQGKASLGIAYLNCGEAEKATLLYEQALQSFKQLGDIQGVARTNNNLGNVFVYKQDWERAIYYYEEALQVQEQLDDRYGLAQIWGSLGNGYKAKGEWDKASDLFEKSLKIFECLGARDDLATTYTNLASICKEKRNWIKTIDFYEKALDIYEQMGDERFIDVIYRELGNAYESCGDLDEALAYYSKASKSQEQLGRINQQAQTWANLGNMHLTKREWEKAIYSYEQALPIYEQANDSLGKASIWKNLGTAYMTKGETDKAADYYEQAQSIFQESNNIQGLAQIWGSLGMLHMAGDNLDKALGSYEKALQAFEQLDDIQGLATTYINLGIAYKAKGEWKKSITFYEQASQMYEKLGDNHGLAQALGNLGNIYKDEKAWSEATRCYERALEIFQLTGNSYAQALTYDNLGILLMAQDMSEEAKPLFAKAYLIFSELGAQEAETAGAYLLQILGTVEAANHYLQEMAGSN